MSMTCRRRPRQYLILYLFTGSTLEVTVSSPGLPPSEFDELSHPKLSNPHEWALTVSEQHNSTAPESISRTPFDCSIASSSTHSRTSHEKPHEHRSHWNSRTIANRQLDAHRTEATTRIL
ncbi:hypothetical protein BC629DRAFT_1512786, partial [Irpex lacteus]